MARESRDARFDGLFFTAVRSTRVYCRSICPAPTCKRTNVVYYPSAAAAQAAGYRPCLRCRPELAPDPNVDDDAQLRRALMLIADGFLADASLEALASEVGMSSRHLRRRFVERLGATPSDVHATQRLLQAKRYLSDTHWPIAQVAAAASFTSVRRFNAAFREGYRMSPSEMRRRAVPGCELATSLRLHYRPPFDLAATLGHLASAAVPGVEAVIDGSYLRAFGTAKQGQWLRVSSVPGRAELQLDLFGVTPVEIQALVRRVRRQFDLDADFAAMQRVLSRDPSLATRLETRPGLRLPGAWDGFELTIAELLALAPGKLRVRDALMQIVGVYGEVHPNAPAGLGFMFPGPERLAVIELESMGMDIGIARRIRTLALAVRDGALHFGPGQALESFVQRLCAATDLPEQRAHWVALRALGEPDANPLPNSTAHKSSSWRPWRAYGFLYDAEEQLILEQVHG